MLKSNCLGQQCIHICIAYLDKDFNFIRVNDAYAKSGRREPEDFTGKNHFDLYPHEENEAIFKRVVETGEPYSVSAKPFDHPERREQGLTYWDWSLSPVTGAKGEIEGVVLALLDVTERKHIEAQLFQSQKTEAIGRLAGGIAHDFNNLLQVIGGRARRAVKHLDESNPARNEIMQVLHAEESATTLTRQLLAFGRKQELKTRVLDLNEVLLGLGAMLRSLIGEDIRISIYTEDGIGGVEADSAQMEQVIMNLVVNARDAMTDGGNLTLATSAVRLDELNPPDYHTLPAGDYVKLEVTDTGCGMEPDTLSQIFDPFFTTKSQDMGTGLGLSMVYGTVRQVGGDIRVYSKPGTGTTFNVYLPVAGESVRAEEDVDAGGDAALYGTETLLLIEDHETVRKLLVLELEDLGYEVLDASDDTEALDLCEKQGGKIDLVITDVVMPGMSGPEIYRLISEKYPGIGVLYCSGHRREHIADISVQDGNCSFIRKPFTAETLAREIRGLID